MNLPNWLPLTFRSDDGPWLGQAGVELLDQRHELDPLHDPQLVLRFGYAPRTCYTNRRPIADVIEP